MILRFFLGLVLFLSLSFPAAAQLVVIPGNEPAAARIEALLQFGGFAFRRLKAEDVSPSALSGARVVVIIRAPLAAAGAEALGRFAAEGGKLVLIGQEGVPELYRAVGVEAAPAQPPQRFERIVRAGAAPASPAIPAIVRDLSTPPLSLTPLPGTMVLARHALAPSDDAGRASGDRPAPLATPPPSTRPAAVDGPAAVTLAAGGAAISGLFAPGDRWEKCWLLQGVLAAVDPALGEPARRGLVRQGDEALKGASAHWARVRDQAGVRRSEREAQLRTLQALRSRWVGLRGDEGAKAGAAVLQEFIRGARELDLGLTASAPEEIRGIWIHTYSPTDWDRVARRVKAAGLNSLFVRVGRGGNLIYPSALLPRDAWAEKAGGDELQRAINAAHRHGLQFHAWRVNFHMGSAPKEYRDRMAAEDRLVRDPQGKQADFANPADPRNQELEFQVMRELVEKYDIDGLQFDYIRYPEVPHYDFDYGAVSRWEFERKLGKPVGNWALDVISGPLKTAYEDWERGNVNRLVERVHGEVKRLKPSVQVSAAVWRNHRRYRAAIKQDWSLWVERGWLDFVAPMDYTPEMDTFAATVDGQVALTRGRAPVAVGIGNWLLETPEELARQVEIAREAGADGFILFAYNAEQIEEQLAGLRLGATATDARFPFQVPGVRITLASAAVDLKDTPLAVTAGSRIQVRVDANGHRLGEARALTPLPPLPASGRGVSVAGTVGVSWRVLIERPGGELVQDLGAVKPGASSVLSGVAPAGRFRAVLRGTGGGGTGGQPFVVRGPLIEGLGGAEIAALRAQERPPVFAGGVESDGPRVGVYMGGLGAETALAALKTQAGVRVAPVFRLRTEHLTAVDTLLLPQLADVAELDAATQARLRGWVEAGGTLVLTHDAVGTRWHPRLFPELVRDVALSPATPLETEGALGEVLSGSRVGHGGADQFRITPGPAARVLLREAASGEAGPGAAVVVTGAVGRGTVVLVGFLSGYLETRVSGEEARLLAALTRYRVATGPLSGNR